MIGGGCYGCYHARQLAKALLKGTIAARDIVIVDRNPACRAAAEFANEPAVRLLTAGWDDFLDSYLALRAPETRDRIVPTPVASHLLGAWLLRRARAWAGDSAARLAPPPGLPPTPFATWSPQGTTGYLSFATWTCPVTCIEPAICPKTRGPRDWEMDDAIYAFARGAAAGGRPFDGVEVFRCRHYAYGIGTIPTSAVIRAGRRLERLLRRKPRRDRRLLVGTVSSCHGVLEMIQVFPGA